MDNLSQLAVDVIEQAVKSGASAADCVVREGSEASATIRCGEIEQVKEAASKALGLRVFLGQRMATTYTSDFSADGVNRLVSSAIAAAAVTSEDPFAGLPSQEETGVVEGDLGMFDDAVTRLNTETMIDSATRAEKAAFAVDSRITNSEGSGFESGYSRRILANSHGFVGDYRRSSCSISVTPIAEAKDSKDASGGAAGMQRDYWYSVSRKLAGLESPESVGKIAAQRTLRRLNARKIATCKVPVVFDPRAAQGLLGSLFGAVNGDAIYRKASFLAGKLGEKIASEKISIVDDGLLAGGLGSSPFDDEGVKTRRTSVVERGVLNNYLLNSYTARKLNMPTTGNASRSLAGNPGIGPTNFYIIAGASSPEEILASVSGGFYVTELIGHGANVVTGDFSFGAAGLWIEKGELAYAVDEVTVAGNLLPMLESISMVGSDLEFRGSVASPTLKVDELTVGGV